MKPKLLAIYLPQYHPIPENNKAWGEGFTEWTNVKRGKPLFENHYQPHVPHDDLGYYDLTDVEIMKKQVGMAQEYGIHGFAFYHYWFNGKRLLNLPLDNFLKSKEIDFPFCYIWANEHWSKRWDGSEHEIIQPQAYSFEDDLAHIRFLCENVFADDRYIKINGKPLFVVYRTELFPDISKTAEIWRTEVKKYGFDGIYLVRAENFVSGTLPSEVNFDAALEFTPNTRDLKDVSLEYIDNKLISKTYHYEEVVANQVAKEYNYKTFRCVSPSWDNTARKKDNITVYVGSDPDLFCYSLRKMIEYTQEKFTEDEAFIFVNAWNEWGEGCHVEPDKKYGYKYLEAIKDALSKEKILSPENYCNYLEKNRYKLLQKLTLYQNEARLYHSKYYKLGRVITYPFRKVKSWFTR